MSDSPLLAVEHLRKEFGALVATNDASFTVQSGTITGLIGPNGAGKSTLFNLISGFYTPDSGTVRLGGTDITGWEPYEIVAEGLIRTFQTPRTVEGMTVREAMLVGPQDQPGESMTTVLTNPSRVADSEQANLDATEEMLADFELAQLATQPATDISGGQMKLVELARAMLADPQLLLLDEPVAGVNPTLANDLATQIERLNNAGTTFLIIEHDMEFIMDIADRIIVLNKGHVLTEGPPASVQADDRVIDAYLGG